MSEYILKVPQICELLGVSRRTITRYIKQGKLKPRKVKSRSGGFEYIFSKDDVLKRMATRRDNATGHKTRGARTDATPGAPGYIDYKSKSEATQSDRTGQATGQAEKGVNEGIIDTLKDTTEVLKDQLKEKDGQIKNLSGQVSELIERNRETNILLRDLQARLPMLENKESEKETQDQEKKSKFKRILTKRIF